MAFFIPSYIQKRLLRYALSRLELLDTDALDLERLGIEWGRRSTIELHNVVLRRRRLTALLNLPSSLDIELSTIASVRVTVPADLYNESIVVRLRGIRIRTRLVEEQPDTPKRGTSGHADKLSEKETKEQRRPVQSSQSGNAPFETSEGQVPSPRDLATSFLEQEPESEKAQLEHELISNYIDLQTSHFSNDGSESSATDTGIGMALPNFLAGFLKSVGDRVQAHLEDISIELLMSPKTLTSDNSSRSSDWRKPVGLRIEIHKVQIEDGTGYFKASGTDSRDENVSMKSEIQQQPESNKRHIRLVDAKLSILVDADSTVSLLSKQTRPSEKLQAGKSLVELSPSSGRRVLSRSISKQQVEERMNDVEDSAEQLNPDGANAHAGLKDGTEQQEIAFHAAPDSFISTFGELMPSSMEHAHDRDTRRTSFPSLMDSEHLKPGHDSNLLGSSNLLPSSIADNAYAEDLLGKSTSAMSDFKSQDISSKNDDLIEMSQDMRKDSEFSNDLIESQLFAQEEARSVYLSAYTGVAHSVEKLSMQIPGGWSGGDTDASSHDQTAGDFQDSMPETSGYCNKPAELPRSAASPPPLATLSTYYDQEHETSQKAKPRDPVTDSKTIPSETLSSDILSEKDILHVTEMNIDLLTLTPNEDLPLEESIRFQDHIQSSNNMVESMRHEVPGSFSYYAESVAASRRRPSLKKDDAKGENLKRLTSGSKTEILVDKVSGSLDHSTCAMLLQIMQSIFEMRQLGQDQPANSSEKTAVGPETVILRTNEICLRIFDESVVSSSYGAPRLNAQGDDVLPRSTTEPLFSLNWESVTAHLVKSSVALQELLVDMGSFNLKLSEDTLLSFKKDPSALKHPQSINSSGSSDVHIRCNFRDGNPEWHVNTGQVLLDINTDRLDEAITTFGSFSGLLQASSHMFGERDKDPGTKPHPNKINPRTVRFESTPRDEPVDPTSSARINIRLGGLKATVANRSCGVRYESTSIKVVSRRNVVATQIDDSRMVWPIVREDNDTTAATLRLRNLSFKYFFTPEEHDLTRLISLLNPSSDKFDDNDDDFILDTLIVQRKKGSAARLDIANLECQFNGFEQFLILQSFIDEVGKLSSVTKYLPQESRPGMMLLASIRDVSIEMADIPYVGYLKLELRTANVAHVPVSSLTAASVEYISLMRSTAEILIHPVLARKTNQTTPMVMVRFLGDGVEPHTNLKLCNFCFEYNTGLFEQIFNSIEHQEKAKAASSPTNKVLQQSPTNESSQSNQWNGSNTPSTLISPRSRITFSFRHSALGLTPRNLPSRGLIMLTDVYGDTSISSTVKSVVDVRKASMLLIDEVCNLQEESTRDQYEITQQVPLLCQQGYASVLWLSATSTTVEYHGISSPTPGFVDVHFENELIVLETCADSTQTLGDLFGALQPARPREVGERYRTEIAPIDDMMASFTGDAFAVIPRRRTNILGSEYSRAEEDDNDDDYDDDDDDDDDDDIFESGALDLSQLELEGMKSETKDLEFGGFDLGTLPSKPYGAASRWNSHTNQYVPVAEHELVKCPLKLQVAHMHVIWNLHDGYDWERTRQTITNAVDDLQAKTAEKRKRQMAGFDEEEDEDPVIGDFLFNSIYIGVPVNLDPQQLERQINHDIDEGISETASQPTTITQHTQSPSSNPLRRTKPLKLKRSKRHKLTFEARGVAANVFAFPPGGETVTSCDIRVQDLEIFDHVPTSTWKKFATFMHDSGPREDTKPMIHLEICDVRPVPELTASELVVRATILPLRLHVDQDALDFMTRFFDFQDDDKKREKATTSQLYLQRVEVYPVPIKLDYKPKKVDYRGLRSGRTTEFMNFFNLDGAELVLKHVIVYGCTSFDKLHQSLEDVWMPDVKRNQLPTVLSGLNGVRTVVNVGTGVRNLITIPIQEYRKDGRIIRSVSKGAIAFAQTTGSELTRFGAKLAVGAHTALLGAETLLSDPRRRRLSDGRHDDDEEEEEKRLISHYADQPTGILQGLKGAARSLERDLLVTRDAIVAVSGEVKDSGSMEGVAQAFARNAPTLILRPMIGASKALSQALMGATNTVDPENRKRVEDKYKRR